MRRAMLYEASVTQFKEDVLFNRITDIMSHNFKSYFGTHVQDPEFNSWQNSLQHVKNIIELAKLKDNKIALEYEVPYNNGRIDCMMFGKSLSLKNYVVVMELKQWSRITPISEENNFVEDEDFNVETVTGRRLRKVAHPSQQVKGYQEHLLNFIEIFEVDETYKLFSCSYCHNYSNTEQNGLYSEVFKPILKDYPLYSKEDVKILAEKLNELLANGNGMEIFNRFMQSPVRPAKKLFEHLADVIDNKPVFSLLNDQIVAKNVILAQVRKAEKSKQKSVVIVEGGPGTGKTVIALNILSELAKKGNKTIFFSSKSKPLIEAIRHKIGRDSKFLFTSLTPFVPSKVEENEIDILIVDEAHRIGRKSNSQFTPAEHRTEMPQIEQLICCAKTAVFFIDDKQRIRSLEVGSIDLIRDVAKKYGAIIEEVELFSQFRCNGSDNYLDWLESMLGYSSSNKILTKRDNYDFKVFNSPEDLYACLLDKEKDKQNSARLVAGYCWTWSKTTNPDGSLVKDVRIGDFAMPWETHSEITPPQGYVKWYEWAYKPEGIKQVGCIYTAQGFEFDYIGVIVGPDIKYDSVNDKLVGDITGTKDTTLRNGRESFDEHVKNIYRVLMSRGIKGCYVYFVDKDVEKYFKNHINL